MLLANLSRSSCTCDSHRHTVRGHRQCPRENIDETPAIRSNAKEQRSGRVLLIGVRDWRRRRRRRRRLICCCCKGATAGHCWDPSRAPGRGSHLCRWSRSSRPGHLQARPDSRQPQSGRTASTQPNTRFAVKGSAVLLDLRLPRA